MRICVTVLLALVLATPVLAGPPAQGVYTSLSGGPVAEGLFSESWIAPSAPGQVGNTVNSASYDGVTLGGQWKLWCGSIAMAPLLVSDSRDGNGTGEVVYQTDYTGGQFWLSGGGPWGDGSQDYTGTVVTFEVTTTYQYVFGTLLGIRSNITTIGPFDGFDNCMKYTISNAAFVGSTDTGTLPGHYPPFMDSSCFTGPAYGGWGTVTDVTLQIWGTCVVSVEESSWGAVKSRYKE